MMYNMQFKPSENKHGKDRLMLRKKSRKKKRAANNLQ